MFDVVHGESKHYENEDEFRDNLSEWLFDRGVKQRGHQTNKDEWARITDIKVNKKHPGGRTGRPDIHIYHTGIEWRFRDLSKPFFIECKRRVSQDDLLQLLRYKYEAEGELDIKKYGQYHVAYASPSTVFTEDPFKDTEYYSYPQFERTLWHLGMGLLRKGYHSKELLLTFNEQEQVVIY